MSDNPIRILLIEDNPGDARLIKEMLNETKSAAFILEWRDLLSSGLQKLAEGGADLVLLDLGLPDSQGLETYAKAQSQFPRVPIVVLSGLLDEAVAIKAVRAGAQVVFHPHLHEAESGGHIPTEYGDPENSFHERSVLCRAAENTCFFASVNYASAGSPVLLATPH